MTYADWQEFVSATFPDPLANLAELRAVAEAVPPSPWLPNGTCMVERPAVARAVGAPIAITYGDAIRRYLLAFQPRTVLALLTRIADLEAENARLRHQMGLFALIVGKALGDMGQVLTSMAADEAKAGYPIMAEPLGALDAHGGA
jgi:hypothetical protein